MTAPFPHDSYTYANTSHKRYYNIIMYSDKSGKRREFPHQETPPESALVALPSDLGAVLSRRKCAVNNAIFSPGQRIPSRSRRKQLLNSACACVRGVSKAHACRAGQEVPTDRDHLWREKHVSKIINLFSRKTSTFCKIF